MTPWAVLPVKSFARAKSRLGLAPAERSALAQALFERAMDALVACPDIAGVLVLTNGDEVEAAARARGAEVLRDPPASTDARLGRIVDRGLAHLAGRAVPGALVIMADLPHLDASAISRLVADMRSHAVVVAPDAREEGTNALGLAPPDCIETCFGNPDSLHRHLALLRQRGQRFTVHRSSAIAFDLDIPADLAQLDGPLPGRDPQAARQRDHRYS